MALYCIIQLNNKFKMVFVDLNTKYVSLMVYNYEKEFQLMMFEESIAGVTNSVFHTSNNIELYIGNVNCMTTDKTWLGIIKVLIIFYISIRMLISFLEHI